MFFFVDWVKFLPEYYHKVLLSFTWGLVKEEKEEVCLIWNAFFCEIRFLVVSCVKYLHDESFTWWLVEEEISFVLKCFCEIWFLVVSCVEYLHDESFTWWLVEEEVSFVLKSFCEIRFLIVNVLIVVATHQRALVVAHCPGGKQEYCLAANIWNLKKIVSVFSVWIKRMVSFDGLEWNLT
jgi:hypothetical protein